MNIVLTKVMTGNGIICKTRCREPVVGANRRGADYLNHPRTLC